MISANGENPPGLQRTERSQTSLSYDQRAKSNQRTSLIQQAISEEDGEQINGSNLTQDNHNNEDEDFQVMLQEAVEKQEQIIQALGIDIENEMPQIDQGSVNVRQVSLIQIQDFKEIAITALQQVGFLFEYYENMRQT